MTYRVAVFDYGTFVLAYLRDYNPSWPGCCLHDVQAPSGAEAKRRATAAHKATCRKKVREA